MIYREEKQPQIPVNHCAWCGSYDLGIDWQQNEAIVTFRRNGLLGNRLKYVICRNCGAVLYQYVAEPWRFPPAESRAVEVPTPYRKI